jgi:hypothetical protein
MTVTVYRSDDASAPALGYVVGSLIGVLDACLVNGYGAKSAAGWAKEFSGTNLAVYRAPTGKRFRLYVDDTALQYSYMRGYMVMSGASDSGDDPFPTVAQRSLGAIHNKASTTATAARPWAVIATDRSFYLFQNAGSQSTDYSTTSTTFGAFFFGDIFTTSADDYAVALSGGRVAANTTAANDRLFSFNRSTNLQFLPRPASGAAGAVSAFIGAQAPGGQTSVGNAGVPVASNEFGGVAMARIPMFGEDSRLRGFLPGAYNPLHNFATNHLDTIAGTGALNGRTLQVQYHNSESAGGVLIDTTGPWY